MAAVLRVADVVRDSLEAAGIRFAFSVPGESFLGLLDRFSRPGAVRLITCRHEAVAAHAAEAAARLTGTPGVVMVTRGPGLSHALIGLHTAQQDSTPLVCLIGQIPRDMTGREAFQEMDYRRLLGSVAKDVLVLDTPSRAAEIMARALGLAASGRPGPVAVVLPEDVLEEDAGQAAHAPARLMPPGLAPEAARAIARRLEEAQRPLLLVGGPALDSPACGAARACAEAWGLGVLTAFRRKDRFDNEHPQHLGELGLSANPALIDDVKAADLVLAVGTLLGENVTQGYTLFGPPGPARLLVHVHPEASAIGRVWQPSLAAIAAPGPALVALAELAPPGIAAPRLAALGEARARQQAWMQPTAVQAGLNPAELVRALSARLDERAIWANGAGNFAAWVHRFHAHRGPGTQLAPVSGAMGYGLAAGLAAALAEPEREVVAFAGDGDLMMVAGDLATLAHERARPLVVVLDNGRYGTIAMHQARDYGRYPGTDLTNPDFVALAHAHGLLGRRLDRVDELDDALAQWRAERRAMLLHVPIDRHEIAPGERIEG